MSEIEQEQQRRKQLATIGDLDDKDSTLEDQEDRISRLERQMENVRLTLVSQVKINIRLTELSQSFAKEVAALERLLARLHPVELAGTCGERRMT